MIADVVTIIGTQDIVFGEVDFLKVKKIKKRPQSQDDNSDDMDD